MFTDREYLLSCKLIAEAFKIGDAANACVHLCKQLIQN